MEIKPEAWVVSCKGWGDELFFTQNAAEKCKRDLETYTGKLATIEALYSHRAFSEISKEARRYASFYPESSDGRNTFVMFAEMIEAKA